MRWILAPRFVPAILVLAIVAVLTLPLGCSTGDTEQLMAWKAQVDTAVEQAQLTTRALSEDVTRLRTALAEVPADAPQRVQIEQALAYAQSALETAERKLNEYVGISDDLETAIQTALSGEITPEGVELLRRIPGVGPYADFGIVLMSLIFGWDARRRARSDMRAKVETVINAWSEEEPKGPTPGMLSAIEKTLL